MAGRWSDHLRLCYRRHPVAPVRCNRPKGHRGAHSWVSRKKRKIKMFKLNDADLLESLDFFKKGLALVSLVNRPF